MPVEKVTAVDQLRLSITQTNYSVSKAKRIGYFIPEVKGVYPFRVRFKDLGYPGFSNANYPGIGLAIIGSSFYVL